MESFRMQFSTQDRLTRTVFGFVGTCRLTVIVAELASCKYLGWARLVRSSVALRSSPRVKVVVLRTMRVTMRFVPFSPRLDVFVDSIDEPKTSVDNRRFVYIARRSSADRDPVGLGETPSRPSSSLVPCTNSLPPLLNR